MSGKKYSSIKNDWRKVDIEIIRYKNPMMRVLIAARKMEEKYMELNRLLNKVT